MNGIMSMDEILALESGDHGGLIGDFPNQSAAPSNWQPTRRREEWYWSDYDYKRVDVIATSMEKNGWDGPPVCVREGVLHNGHHRAIAAYMVGLKEMPVTDDWDESESDFSARMIP